MRPYGIFTTSDQGILTDSDDLDEMERVRKEHIEALREIKRLQVYTHTHTHTIALVSLLHTSM